MPFDTEAERAAEREWALGQRKDIETEFTDAENVTYDGFCHCKAVQYTVRLPRLVGGARPLPVMNCSCSICRKNGYLLVYPLRHRLTFLRGQDHVAGYRFATRNLKHCFCPTCGSSLYIDPEGHNPRGDIVCINVRMLRGVDVDQLTRIKFNGREAARTEYNAETG